MLKTYYFDLPGITCVNCVGPVEKALQVCLIPKIKSIHTDIFKKRIAITVEETPGTENQTREILRGIIEEKGVECRDVSLNKIEDKLWLHLLQGIVGTSAGIALLTLSLVGMAALPMAVIYTIASFSIFLTLCLGVDTYVEAFKKLVKTQTLTMDVLFAVSTLTIVGVSIASFFFPGLPAMFEVGLLIFGFRHLGKAIEESIKQKTTNGLYLRDLAIRKVAKHDGDKTIADYPVAQLKPGDVITVNPGEIIPVDGICLTEQISLCIKRVKGETLPQEFIRGANILAGMQTIDMPIKIQVTKPEAESYLACLDEACSSANSEKAPLESAAQQILKYFIPAVFTLSIISGITIGVLFNPALAIQCAVALLVSACPCTLGFIIPLALKIGQAKAVENGIQFKNGKTLQMAAQIDTVVFDLNGTLTTGEYGVNACYIFDNNLSPAQVCAYLEVLERESTHLVAKAISDYAQTKTTVQDIASLTVTDVCKKHHAGLSAKVNGEDIIIGNAKMMKDNGISVEGLPKQLPCDKTAQLIYLARGKQVIATIVLCDALRPGAKEIIAALKSSGKKLHLCTGADPTIAKYYADQLGIPLENMVADCFPIDKSNYINNLKQSGHQVAMVGDEINDASAMAASDLSVVINGVDNEKLQQEAGLVIYNRSLLAIIAAFSIARQTVRNIKQNLVFSLIYNLSIMAVASGLLLSIGLVLNPGLGVALMVLQTSLVLLNAYHFKQQALPLAEAVKLTSNSSSATALTSAPVYLSTTQQSCTPVYTETTSYSTVYTIPVTVNAPRMEAREVLVLPCP